jgi:hypothetical protein
LCPTQAAGCEAALPGLGRRYTEYVLNTYGVDKPFEADLVVLDRRPMLLREATPAAPEEIHEPQQTISSRRVRGSSGRRTTTRNV